MSEVANAIRELSEQREFLLQNQWVTTGPTFSSILFSDDWQPSGCLLERCGGRTFVRNSVFRMYDPEDYVMVEHPIARRALVWTLAEAGYQVWVSEWDGENDDDSGPYFNPITRVNDGQFTSVGEPIEALERAILNIKQAFGECDA